MKNCKIIKFKLPEKYSRFEKFINNAFSNPDDRLYIAMALSEHNELYKWVYKQDYVKTEDEFINTNGNILKKWFREYLNSTKKDIHRTESKKKLDNSENWSSDNARRTALIYTGNLLKLNYYNNVTNGKPLTKSALITDVRKDIRKKFDTKSHSWIKFAYKEGIIPKSDLDEYSKLVEDLSKLDKKAVRQKKDIKEKIFNEAQRLIGIYANNNDNVVIRNFAQLAQKTHSVSFTKEWFDEVFTNASMFDLYKIFDDTKLERAKDYSLSDSEIEDNESSDIDDYTSSLDTMSASWDNKLLKDFMQNFSDDIKLYLSTIPNRNASIVGLGVDALNSNFEYDPELGVQTFMDTKYVINQLSILGPQRDVNSFIEAIESKAKSISSLYGLGKIAIDMRNNPEFANRIYCNFSKPILNKIQITISDSVAKNGLSNAQDINPFSKLYFNLLGDSNLVGREEYLEADSVVLQNAFDAVSKMTNDSQLIDYDNDFEIHLNNIVDYVKKHFPSLNRENIINYFFDNSNTVSRKNLKSFIQSLIDYNSGLQKALKNENEYNSRYYLEKRDYVKYLESLGGERSYREPPVYDGEAINKKSRNIAILDIVKNLVDVWDKDIRLNSTNAERKMSSNIGKSSYITDLVRQLKVQLENGKDGREILKEYFTKRKYDITDNETNILLFGLKDRNGNVIKQGLFTKNENGEYIINEDSNIVNTFNVSLFDGIRNTSTDEGKTYDKMSKEDYLLSSLLIFDSTLQFDDLNEKQVEGLGNYLMRIPSDASNTYSVQMERFNTKDLYDYGDTSYIDSKADEIKYNLEQYFDKDIESKQINTFWKNIVNELIADNYSKNKNNYLNAEDMINLLSSNKILDVNLLNRISRQDGKTVYVPFIYNDKENKKSFVVLTKGTISDNKSYVKELEIASIRSIEKKEKTKNDISINSLANEFLGESVSFKETSDIKPLINSFIDNNKEFVKNWMFNNNLINRTFNRNSEIFLAFRSQLWGELQQFVTNLNNVFELDEDTNTFISKDSVNGLIDRFHYNGSIVKDGKLSGNVFNFTKLFNDGTNIDALVKDLFAIYEVKENSLFNEPLFNVLSDGRLELNESRLNDIIYRTNNNSVLTIGNDFQSSMNENISNTIDNIIERWLNSFYELTINKEDEFREILNSKYTENNDLFDWALNTSIAYMTFDGIFEGSGKYYKDSQTFLKRAKETQMGGTPYSGANFGKYENKLNDVLDIADNNQVISIKSNDKELLGSVPTYVNGIIVKKPLSLRNGWRAVTIKNSLTVYDRGEYIWKTVYDNVLKDVKDEKVAKDIANKIAAGYGRPYTENGETVKGAPTKANDAQSYITIEEFIRRRQADGTISQYKDLLAQLLDDTVPLSEINYDEVNNKIQAQKNVYYDVVYDNLTGQHRPRQIKNAEFVLIPKLLPEGSSLRVLYDLMRKHDIGQVNTVETSKASNKDVLTFWNNDETFDELKFESQLTGMDLVDGKLRGISTYPNVEDYFYKHLYKQLDVVDHIEDKENKAGIQLFKKIQDNYTEKTKQFVDNIQEAFSANIEDSYNELLDKLGWKNVNGTVVNKDGSTPLKFNKFYEKCLDEFRRIGLDDNVMDYLIPDNTGKPIMPEWMSIFSTKLENIAQSVYNNNITRQTLPGYHGVQISNVGFSRKLKYYPVDGDNTTPIVEIMMPAYSKSIKDLIDKYGKEEAIKKLEEAGLDKHIGYRIPTEGKQSIAIFKVVDFLDESYGSSIIVPNEWVTQTGSDFDIDSIYSIIHESVFDGENISKIDYNLKDTVTATKERYLANLREKIQDSSSEIKERYNNNTNKQSNKYNFEVFNEIQKEFLSKINYIKYSRSGEIIDSLEKGRRICNGTQMLCIEMIGDAFNNGNIANNVKAWPVSIWAKSPVSDDIIDHQITLVKINGTFYIFDMPQSEFITRTGNKFNENNEEFDEGKIGEFKPYLIPINENIISEKYQIKGEHLNNTIIGINNIISYLDKLNNFEIKLNLSKNNEKYNNKDNFEELLNIGDEIGFSYNNFIKLTPIQQLTRSQRNNFILDNIISIMSDTSSMEEIFGRSNFETLTDAKNEVESLGNLTLNSASIYNPFDQLNFMQNAIDGRKLKALSVNRDTFCSICNKVKPIIQNTKTRSGENITNKIRVVYDKTYNKNIASSAYDIEEIDDKFVVTHDKFGWSKNNRNVEGRLITSYSSQTTAHILDAIKEGALFNETDFTFGTFKTLIDVGIDYRTAVAFLAQPAITMINTFNNETNSIYLTSFGNPIYSTIIEISKQLGIVEQNKNFVKINDILSLINKSDKKDKFDYILQNVFYANNVSDAAINGEALRNRLQGKDVLGRENISQEELNESNLIFDLITAFQFRKINNTTKTIENIAKVLRPDSFGAKQIIKEVRDLVDDVNDYRKNKILTVPDGRTIIDSIYTDEDSLYKYLYSFYKYSTVASSELNSQLFRTEQPKFQKLIGEIQDDIGRKLTNEEYLKAKKYIIHDVYDSIPVLNSPVTIDEHGFVILDKENITENAFGAYWDSEKGRVYGLIENEINVPDIDINNPTKEDISKFTKLTPAQKVLFMKQKYNDEIPFISRINVVKSFKNELNTKKYSYNRLFINDLSENIDTLRKEFSTLFFNKDVFAKLTAVDLVKYAFIVEGYDFKKQSIGRCIPNECIIAKINEGGLDLLDKAKAEFEFIFSPIYGSDARENFIRANSDLVKTVTLKQGDKNKPNVEYTKFIECYNEENHLVKIPKSEQYEDLLKALGFNDRNSNYIKIQFNTDGSYKNYNTYLYKIIYNKFTNDVYLIPINTLESFENSRYSVNNANNEHYDYSYYIRTLRDDIDSQVNMDEMSDEEDINTIEELRRITDTFVKEVPVYKFKNQFDENKLINSLPTGNETYKIQLYKFFNDINEIITHNDLSSYVVENSSMVISQLLDLKGDENGKVYNIPKDDGTLRVKITRYNTKSLIKYQTSKNKTDNPTLEYYSNKFGDVAKTGKKFYKIDILAEEDTEKGLLEYDNRDSKYSFEDDIYGDSLYNTENPLSDTLSALIAKDIRKHARRGEDAAIKANERFILNGIVLNNLSSLTNRSQTVYSIANKYYKNAFDSINAQINSFELSNGNIYSIDDSELYKNAIPEDFQRLLSLVLKANHFAESLQDIYEYDLKGEDAEVQKEIELLKGYVNSFKNNNKLKVAINKIFNKYLVSNYSSNPLFKTSFIDSSGNTHRIIEATDVFGDISFLTSQISDVGNIPHKQLQIIVKTINERLNEAEFVGREKVQSFEKWIKDNIGDNANEIFNKIIDENGKIIQPYSDKFLEDKYRFKEELKDIEQTYGRDSVEYFKKDLEYKKWKLNNTEQRIKDDYYRRYIDILETAFDEAGETLVKYRALVNELYNIYGDTYNLTDEELKQKERINKELSNIVNDYDENGNLKSDDELKIVDAIRNYKEELATLNHEYFTKEPSEEFKQNLKYNLNIIKNYDSKHKNLTLPDKLEDIEYRTAYNWIRSNTRYRLNDKAREALNKAYAALKLGRADKVSNSTIKQILSDKSVSGNLYDMYGTIIGTNFTEDEIKTIRDIEASRYSPVEEDDTINYNDNALYKNIPEQELLTKDFWENVFISNEEKDDSVIKRKKEIFTEINKIISKGINLDNGLIEARRLFNNCTQDELDELSDLYTELRGLTSSRNKNNKKLFEFKRNEADFAKQYAIYSTLKPAEKRFFESIFCEIDKNGEVVIDENGKFVPNGFIYGYVTLSDSVRKAHPEYIDTKRQDALKLIQENEIFEETEYYFNALNKNLKEAQEIYDNAISSGKTEKEAEKLKNEHIDTWYYNNHIWNKYTNQWQPISIWRVRRINENGTLPGEYKFEPIGDNFEREIIDGQENPNYSEFGANYKVSTGEYNNSRYSGIISDTNSKKYKLYKYIENIMQQAAVNNSNRRFISEGWAPRKYKVVQDANWYIKQGLGVLGLNTRNYNNRSFTEVVDYEHDHDVKNNMLQLLKTKGYEELEKIPEKDANQTEEDYNKLVNEINQRNNERRKRNLELEKAVRDDDWYNVFRNFIYRSTQVKAKEDIKDLAYLMIDDLKDRRAYKVNAFGKVSKNRNDEYLDVEQRKVASTFENWARRIIYGEYKELSRFNKFADTLQNLASAKYMIFNIYAGINNVSVGAVNILGERFAKDYFGNKEWLSANKEYRKSMFNFMKDTFSDVSNDRTVAIIKMFDVVDIDRILDFTGNSFELSDIAKHFNTIAYSLQSGGEHYMQNTALIAILKSHRIYNDFETGKPVVGSFGEYVSGIENAALSRVISGNSYLTALFNQLKSNIKKDKQLQYEYDILKRNVVADFFNSIQDKTTREKYQKEYITLRKEMLKNDREEFEKHKSAWDSIEFENGVARWAKGSGLDSSHLGFLKNRAIYCNKQIHGVYDKNGAAQIEKHWWGSLVMQFKKHIWPGIMKRYNTKGYYNEQRGTFEKGSYISVVDFLGTEFRNFKSKYNDKYSDESLNALGAIQTTFECIIDTIHNFKYNYDLLPVWEQHNILRALSDLCGVMAALLTTFAIYALTDNDDLKENTLLNSTLYLADRLYGESRMYTPMGIVPEVRTQWRNPIAGSGVVEDLMKSMSYTTQWLFDPNYTPVYKSGPNKGRNKVVVTVRKNIPALRTIERIKTINTSNKYFRIGDNNASQKIVKSIAKKLRNETD